MKIFSNSFLFYVIISLFCVIFCKSNFHSWVVNIHYKKMGEDTHQDGNIWRKWNLYRIKVEYRWECNQKYLAKYSSISLGKKKHIIWLVQGWTPVNYDALCSSIMECIIQVFNINLKHWVPSILNLEWLLLALALLNSLLHCILDMFYGRQIW